MTRWPTNMNNPIPKELQRYFDEFNSSGETTVKFNLSKGTYSNDSAKYRAAQSWLDHITNKRNDDFNEIVLRLTDKQTAAAEKQARWAMWTVIISVVSLIVSAAAYMKQV